MSNDDISGTPEDFEPEIPDNSEVEEEQVDFDRISEISDIVRIRREYRDRGLPCPWFFDWLLAIDQRWLDTPAQPRAVEDDKAKVEIDKVEIDKVESDKVEIDKVKDKRKTWWSTLLASILQVVAGFGTSAILIWLMVQLPPVFLPVLGFALVWTQSIATYGIRGMQVEPVHQVVHEKFSGQEDLDEKVSEAISSTFLLQDSSSYQDDHREHHAKAFGTSEDPDGAFMKDIGLAPGRSMEELVFQLVWTPLSPSFHLKYMKARLKANLGAPKRWRRVLPFAIWTVLAGVFITTPFGPWLALAMLPNIFGWHHIASLGQFSSEHLWFKPRRPGQTAREHYAELCHGRFVAPELPSESLRDGPAVMAWGWWLLKIMAATFVRLNFLQKDLPHHDLHHRFPSTDAWLHPDKLRIEHMAAGCPRWPAMTEHTSYLAAVRAVLEAISEAPSEDDED